MTDARDMNRNEYAAREEKAHKLADYARSHNIDSAQLESAAKTEWEELAFYAGVKTPSEETAQRVVQLVQSQEKPVDPDFDPFEGLV